MNTLTKLPEHTSYSQLNLYEHCPRCWYLNYVLKVETHPSDALLFGGQVHDAIDYYHRKNGQRKPNLPDRQVYKALDAYAKRFKPQYLDETEKGLFLTFRHPDTGEPLQKKFKLFIDGIRLAYNNNLIAEHKTAAQMWKWDRVHQERQTSLYSYAFRALFGFEENGIQYNIIKKPKDNIGSNYPLQVMFTKRDRSDYADFWYWAHGILENIKKGNFDKKPHIGWKCDRCKVCC